MQVSAMSSSAELLQLIHNDIPEGRRHLADSHMNLEKVAAYCEGNYLQSPEKRHALEETKNYTTQSLASVAYQINTLATNFLHLLDLQMNQLSDMESSVNHLSQTVGVHKEKVARREIGVLTTNKSTTRPAGVKNPGIIFPDQQERPIKYVRKPIDYNALDDIGHGLKTSRPPQQTQVRRSSSARSQQQQVQGPPGPAGPPTTRPPTPPQQQMIRPGANTLPRQQSPYRTPSPHIAPPSVPGHYAPGYQRGPVPQQLGDRRSGGYAPGRVARMNTPPPAPPTGMVYPMTHQPPMSQQSMNQQAMGQAMTQQAMNQVAMSQQQMMSHPGMNHSGHISHAGVTHQPPSPSPPPPPMPQAHDDMPPPPPLPDVAHGRGDDLPPPMIHAYDPAGPVPPPAFVLAHQPTSSHYGRMGDPRARHLPGQAPRPGRQSGHIHQDEVGELPPAPAEVAPAQTAAPPQFIEKVVAIYDYEKDKTDELSFCEGSVIYVIKKNDDGWWEGVLDGVTGLFPGNYVEPCM